MFYSDAKQDRFVANMLNFQDKGFYLDIGSAHSTNNNNTFYFDLVGWIGICVEFNQYYNDTYKNRKACLYINEDALKLNYDQLIDTLNTDVIDYISLDIDQLSYEVLKLLPLKKVEFKVMTIEHDYYNFGKKYQDPQREYLSSLGYYLICSNVCVEQPDFKNERSSFEDWWINPKFFTEKEIREIKSDWLYPSQIISKFNKKQNWYV